MSTSTLHSITIEDVLEPLERNIGENMHHLMEPNPEYIPLPPMSEEILDLTEVTPSIECMEIEKEDEHS